MSRFAARTVESVGPGPSVQAPGDGLEGHYKAILNSVPSGGSCLVIVPALDPLHHMEANCPANATGSVGDIVFVGFDDEKSLWVVTPTLAHPSLLTLGIARGTTSATFTSSSNSATVTVSHGLGSAPTSVQLTASGISGVRTDVFAALVPGSKTSSQFQFIAFVGNQSVPSSGTCAVDWLAVI